MGKKFIFLMNFDFQCAVRFKTSHFLWHCSHVIVNGTFMITDYRASCCVDQL